MPLRKAWIHLLSLQLWINSKPPAIVGGLWLVTQYIFLLLIHDNHFPSLVFEKRAEGIYNINNKARDMWPNIWFFPFSDVNIILSLSQLTFFKTKVCWFGLLGFMAYQPL